MVGKTEFYAETKEEWLRGFLELPHGVSSDDSFRRLLAALDAEHFQNCFMDWMEAVEELTAGQVIVVTPDALHCQLQTVVTIVDRGADYILPVKENQPRLLEAIQELFDDPEEMHWVACEYHRTESRGHGRTEIRECWSTSDPDHVRFILGILGE